MWVCGCGCVSKQHPVRIATDTCARACVCVCVRVLLVTWHTVRPWTPRAPPQAAFIESILNSGSGLVSLLTFGLCGGLLAEWAALFNRMRKAYRARLFGAADIGYLSVAETARSSPQTIALVQAACREPDLVKTRRYLLRTYEDCFVCSELVSWLLRSARVTSRSEGLQVGRQLEYVTWRGVM